MPQVTLKFPPLDELSPAAVAELLDSAASLEEELFASVTKNSLKQPSNG